MLIILFVLPVQFSVLFYSVLCSERLRVSPRLPCPVATSCLWLMGGNEMKGCRGLIIHSLYSFSAKLMFHGSFVTLRPKP